MAPKTTEEVKSGSTQTKYEGTEGQNLVDENIDPKILKLLGQEFVGDLSYDDYKSLLKAEMAAGRMPDSKMSTEDVELLTNEFKRVKSKTGKFKVKGQKVKTESFVGKKKTTTPKVDAKKLLPPAKIKTEELKTETEELKTETKNDIQEELIPLSSSLAEIEKNLAKLLDINEKQLSLNKEESNSLSKESEDIGAKEREEKLETIKPSTFKKVEKVLAPAKSFLDGLVDFFTNILMGGALSLIVDIVQNPGKYLKPLFDFMNTIIDNINSTLEWTLDNVIMAPINWYIDYLNLLVTGLEKIINGVSSIIPGLDQVTLDRVPKPNLDIPDIPKIEYPEFIQQKEGGGTIVNVNNITFKSGGLIGENSGIKITGMGNDTQLIAAQPGEVVMSKKAVDLYGEDKLLAANAAAGGNNQPKFGKIMGFEGGGVVKPVPKFGKIMGFEGGVVKPVPKSGKIMGFEDGGVVPKSGKIMGFEGGGVVKPVPKSGKIMGFEGGVVPKSGKIMGFEGGGVVKPVPKGSYKGQSGQKFGDPRSYGGHAGIDITEDAPWGSDPKIPVVAMTDGKVVKSSPGYPYTTSGYTSNLTIDHGNNILATYLHMSPFLKPGDEVKKGQRIGSLIDLEDATHLHLQMYQNGNVINPLDFIKGSGTLDLGASSSPTSANIQSSPSKTSISPPSSGQGSSVVPLPMQGQQSPGSGSSSSPSQKKIPSFSAEDDSNNELIVVKSIYNIVG